MSEGSLRRTIFIPLGLLAAMVMAAAMVAAKTGVDGSGAFKSYLIGWSSLTLILIMIRFFYEIARMTPRRVDRPIGKAARRMGLQERPLILPAVIFPLFLGAYTWAKCSIPFIVGYPWERFWAGADHAILGMDAWRLAHAALGNSFASAWTYFYAVVWASLFALSGCAIGVLASRQFTARFFTAMMLTWFFGGFVLAYSISAAGPVFAHLADPTLIDRFAPLRSELVASLGRDDIVIRSQRYLAAGVTQRSALKGGGISAMPSMHIAAAVIFALAAFRTSWFVPALIFLALTFVGSIYLGYHYLVDAPVAALVAIICWLASSRVFPAVVEPEPDQVAFTRR